MKKTCVLVVVTGLVSMQAAYPGDISGTVMLKGTPPPEKENTNIKADQFCGKLHTEPVTTHFYVVGANHGLGDVFVTLKGISGKSAGAAAPPTVLDQKGCEYLPYVFAVQTNQKIVVKNSDPVMHNVHPIPAAPGNKWVGLVLLFSAETGEPLAIFPDGIIQGIRVAASSALAARFLSREDSAIVGILGSGWQARAHAKAMCSVRAIKKILVHSPTKANRDNFAAEVEK